MQREETNCAERPSANSTPYNFLRSPSPAPQPPCLHFSNSKPENYRSNKSSVANHAARMSHGSLDVKLSRMAPISLPLPASLPEQSIHPTVQDARLETARISAHTERAKPGSVQVRKGPGLREEGKDPILRVESDIMDLQH